MSNKSNNNGRGYEYICLQSLYKRISAIRNAKIIINTSYNASEKAWNTLSKIQQKLYKDSAESIVGTIFDMEPRIIEKADDILNLYIQKDEQGEKADVRDIIIERKDIIWKIGLSIKHNHFAVKHCRLSKRIDFCKKWFDSKCSKNYWNNIEPIFTLLEREKAKGTLFKDIVDKDDVIYHPLLVAFIKELNFQIDKDETIPCKLVEYLLGKYDFYKIISVDARRETIIQSFNIYGTLNQRSKEKKPVISIHKINLPSKLIYANFKSNSKTTIILCLDNGWQFSLRIHNASSKVEPSLKFDVQLVGIPAEINLKYICKW